MKKLQATIAILSASALLVTGLVPTGVLTSNAYAAEADPVNVQETEAAQNPESADVREDESVSNQDSTSVTAKENGRADTQEKDAVSETVTDTEEVDIQVADTFEELVSYAPADLDVGKDQSPYACHRLLVFTEDDLQETYGATDAAFYTEDGGYRLCYESDEATKAACDALTEIYGEDAVLPDLPISFSAEETTIAESGSVEETPGDEASDGEMADTQATVSSAVTDGTAYAAGWGTSYMHLDGISQKVSADDSADPVTVAVLDTGILAEHEVFAGKTISDQSVSMIPDTSIVDENGHGTAVAGIIAESTPDNVELMIVRIADKGGNSTMDYMTNGLAYAAEHGADVANISLNAYYSTMMDPEKLKNPWPEERVLQTISVLEEKLERVKEQGVVICASAGNNNLDIAASYNYPAMSAHVLSVGSINEDGKKSSFSDYGDVLDFVAPGEVIQCAWNTGTDAWVAKKGTSMASPYIAAACAMIKAQSPKADFNETESQLASLAKDLGEEGKDQSYGYGVPVFAETAVYDQAAASGNAGDAGQNVSENASDAAESDSQEAELVQGVTLPDWWDPEDPESYKAYEKIYGLNQQELSYSDGSGEKLLGTSAITAKTKWLVFDKDKYNAKTKKNTGSTYATFQHDSMNTTDGQNLVPIIDVSYHNDSPDKSTDDINWSLVKSNGVKGVIIRCGYRQKDSGNLSTDKQFYNFIKGAKSAGLMVGVYFYSQAITKAEGAKEAEYAVSLVKKSGVSLDLPVTIDVEHYSASYAGRLEKAKLSKAAQTAIAEAFCDKVAELGYKPMVYSGSYFLTSYMDGNKLHDDGYKIWMARYRYAAYSDSSIFYNKPVEMWQCTSSAAVDGVATGVDLSYWYQWDGYPVAESVTDAAVTGFSARQDSTSQLTLNWNALPGVVTYRIYYYTTYNKKAVKIDDVPAGTTSKVITGLKEGQEVYFRIQPIMEGVQFGKASDQITAQTAQKKIRLQTAKKLALKQYPNGGSTLTKIPSGTKLKRLAYTTGSNGVTWYKVKYSGMTGYISGASGNTSYYVSKVATPWQSGNYKNKIRVKWKSVSDAEKYAVYRATARNGKYKKIGTVSADQTQFIDTKRAAGRQYYYRIRSMQKVDGSWQYGPYSKIQTLHTKRTKTIRVKIKTDVNMRKYAGTAYKKIKVIPAAKKFKVLYSTKDKSGTTWYQIKYKKGAKTYVGYVSSKFAKKY